MMKNTEENHLANKHFDDWNELAKSLHKKGEKFPFRERDLWWYAAGENIGTEINGKGERFARPILIVRKYGEDGFFGVPISSQLHNGIWYAEFIHKNKVQCALLSQASTYSVHRLYGRIGRIGRDNFARIIQALAELLLKLPT